MQRIIHSRMIAPGPPGEGMDPGQVAEWQQTIDDLPDTVAQAAAAAVDAEPRINVLNDFREHLGMWQYSVLNPDAGTVAVGDGTTDDHAAIQARLDGLSTTPDGGRGGKVVLEPGRVYGISETLEVTLPNTDLDGLVGGSFTTLGACTIKALSGFTGPLIRVAIPSGSKGSWIRNLRLDGNNEAGVTAGIEFANGNVSVGNIFDVAIANVPRGIKTGSNCQSLVWERVLASYGCEVGIEFGANNRHMIVRSSRIGGSRWATIIGPDSASSSDETETIIFDGCELYGHSGTAEGVVLIRKGENTRLLNCYVELSTNGSQPTVTSLIQVGTATSRARNPNIEGCRVGANAQATYAVELVNTSRPFIAGNGHDNLIGSEQVLVTDTTTYGTVIGWKVTSGVGMLLAIGDNGTSGTNVKTPLQVEYGAGGSDLVEVRASGDTFARYALRPNEGLRMGSGSAAADVVFGRGGANVARLASGDTLHIDMSHTAPLRTANGYLWVDTDGVLRIKAAAPASDKDGTVVGAQT